MLCEQIEDEKGKITSERFPLADEETQISFWTPVNMRGLEVSNIGIFIATQRPEGALFGRGNSILRSEGDEDTSSYSGSGIGKIQDGKVSRRRAVYSHTKDHVGRWH